MTIHSWRGVIALEDEQTGDGRVFAPASLDWPELPLPLAWLVDGDQHVYSNEAPVIGTIDTIERVGNEIRATGGIDDEDDPESDGSRAVEMMQNGSAPFGSRFGVSVDGDDWDVEIVDMNPGDDQMLLLASGTGPIPSFSAAAGEPDPGEGGGDTGSHLMDDAADGIITRFRHMRIRGATLCAVPAFDGAYIELADATAAPAEPVPAATTAHAGSAAPAPPDEWFADPQLPGPQRWTTITDEGRIFGHLATFGQCHIGYPNECITPEMLTEGGFDFAQPGHVVAASGERIGTMPLAIKGGHAETRGRAAYDWRAAQAHYDDTSAAFADVAVGRDEFGVWYSGRVRSSATDEQVAICLASGVSGDWREIGPVPRLIGACCVNTPGFPKPQMVLASGRVVALVAAGGAPESAFDHGPDCGCGTDDELTARRLARLEAINSDAIFASLDARLASK